MIEKKTVAVVGASGYAGSELIRWIISHPRLKLGSLMAKSTAGSTLVQVHPQFAGSQYASREIQEVDVDVLNTHDAVILALPHGASAALVKDLAPEVMILDCGADFRLESAEAWQRYYGGAHPGSWVYGLAELPGQVERISQATRVAVPGCNVMAVTLGLLPAISGGLITAEHIVAVLANGYSGAGKATKPHLLLAQGEESATAYSPDGTHRHIPEIIQNLQKVAQDPAGHIGLTFVPTLVPMSRGILATISAPLSSTASTLDALAVHEIWAKAYANSTFVHVLEQGMWPRTASTIGTNTAQVQASINAQAGSLVVSVAIDNLGIGTSANAIRCLNLMFDWPEDLGLQQIGFRS